MKRLGRAVLWMGAAGWRALASCLLFFAACALLLYAGMTARRTAPVVETVTTPARPAAATLAAPLYNRPQLPARDADVEMAGDRIAEAEVYLKKRQGAAALAALGRARRAASRALESRQRAGSRGDELLATLKGLDAAQRAIEHGSLEDAHRQLVALDKGLDRLSF